MGDDGARDLSMLRRWWHGTPVEPALPASFQCGDVVILSPPAGAPPQQVLDYATVVAFYVAVSLGRGPTQKWGAVIAEAYTRKWGDDLLGKGPA